MRQLTVRAESWPIAGTFTISYGGAVAIAVVSGAIEDYATLERALVEHEINTVFHLAARTAVLNRAGASLTSRGRCAA